MHRFRQLGSLDQWTANNNNVVKEETNEYFTARVYFGCFGGSSSV
jgi:hypothetical protein